MPVNIIVYRIALIVAILFFVTCNSKAYIRVGVIDSGIDAKYADRLNLCKDKPGVDYTGTGLYSDETGHGTNVASLIQNFANISKSSYCIIMYKVWTKNLPGDLVIKGTIDALRQADLDGVDIINISMASPYSYSRDEHITFLKILSKGIIVLVAAGNQGLNLQKNCNVYPACYSSKILVVANVLADGLTLHPKSNYGSNIIDLAAKGCSTPAINGLKCGTSQATAIASGLVVRRLKEKGL